jgi:hypothetical protein
MDRRDATIQREVRCEELQRLEKPAKRKSLAVVVLGEAA